MMNNLSCSKQPLATTQVGVGGEGSMDQSTGHNAESYRVFYSISQVEETINTEGHNVM